MILLPMACIKDAARAVKPICRQEFADCKDTILTTLLGISVLAVTMYSFRREGDQEVLHLLCAHRSEGAICPKCGAFCEHIHEEKKRCIRHTNIWGKKTFLHFLSRRFLCDCGNEFTEELRLVDQWRHQSRDFEFHIYESCLKGSRKQVAKRERLSQSTVREIFNRWAQFSAVKSGRVLTRVVGIDEISLKMRHKQFALVISDVERNCILEVLPVRKRKAFEEWIDNLSEAERRTIHCVSIDMWAPYFHAVRNRLPKAKIVVDRFHVMKHLNERITQLGVDLLERRRAQGASLKRRTDSRDFRCALGPDGISSTHQNHRWNVGTESG